MQSLFTKFLVQRLGVKAIAHGERLQLPRERDPVSNDLTGLLRQVIHQIEHHLVPRLDHLRVPDHADQLVDTVVQDIVSRLPGGQERVLTVLAKRLLLLGLASGLERREYRGARRHQIDPPAPAPSNPPPPPNISDGAASGAGASVTVPGDGAFCTSGCRSCSSPSSVGPPTIHTVFSPTEAMMNGPV